MTDRFHLRDVWEGAKPVILMMFVQAIYAGVAMSYKLAAAHNLNVWILIAYRYMFAAAFMSPLVLVVERKRRPKLTWTVLFQAFCCGALAGTVVRYRRASIRGRPEVLEFWDVGAAGEEKKDGVSDGAGKEQEDETALSSPQMPSSKRLSSIFRFAIEAANKASSSSATFPAAAAAATKPPPPSASLCDAFLGRLKSSSEPVTRSSSPSSKSRKPSPKTKSNKNLETRPSYSGDVSRELLSNEIASTLHSDVSGVSSDVGEEDSTLKPVNSILTIPWLEKMSMSLDSIPVKRKLVSRLRKEKWTFKNTQGRRFNELVTMCATKLGAEATLKVFDKLGRETGVKEYNALIGFCIDKARSTDDEEVALEEITKAFRLFEAMKEQGFRIVEDIYGPLFHYLIDTRMVDEFHSFAGLIKEDNQNSASRFCYYEMLLYLRIDDDQKIQNLCEQALHHVEDGNYDLLGNCMLALCESDRKELFQLLESVDIVKIPSIECVRRVFGSLGRLQMEPLVEKFLLELKNSDHGPDNISNFISNFAACEPNLAVEDVISKYRTLHDNLDIKPSPSSYENLVTYCCTALQVHTALDLVDEMCESGVPVSMEAIHSVLQACDDNYDYYLVHQIYSMIWRHNLKTNVETFKSMINLAVKMKDFGAAYSMLGDLRKLNLSPTSGMYNVIMAGYFREKNIKRGLEVFQEMKLVGVNPDSQSFTHLINICSTKEDIVKYYRELDLAGVLATKHVFMALINAYGACGEFEKAKRVIEEKGIPFKNLNEIKSVLISDLAARNHMSDALDLYEEIKQNGGNIEFKAIMSLIEHFPPGGDLKKLHQLTKEITYSNYWIHGCQKAILWCIQGKHLSVAVDLLKQLKDRVGNNEFPFEAALLEVFCLIAESDATYLQIGFDLLKTIKDDFGILPPRKVLDFLLTACMNARNASKCRLIWKNYQAAGLPYNVLTLLRMYQALLASGDHKSARELLKKIPRDDVHVCLVIKQCKEVYLAVVPPTRTLGKKKTKKKSKA